MQLNYFGCLRVTMGLLPGMVAKRKGTSSTSARSAC
jgi:NADP-dependent 3-hydroxy acid dehydrogenase YdfG